MSKKRGDIEGLTRDLAEARSLTEKWRFEAQSVSRALTILRGQHEAYVIATGGAPAPATPLLRRHSSGKDDEEDGGKDDGDGETAETSPGVANRGDVAAPRRASEAASPAASSAEVGDDSERGGEREGGGGGGGDDNTVALDHSESV
jgi:hypothetical protein